MWERRPFPPCALGAFEFLLFSCLVLTEFRFSFVDSWPWVDEVFLEDWVTLWSGSNPSSLVIKTKGSRVYLNWRFLRYWENPVLAREFLDSSQTLEWFVDSFCGHGHKSFVIVPANFGEVWTRFDLPIIEFWIEPRGKTEFLGSGRIFLYRRLNRRLHSFASDQPVSGVFTC